jgi:transglutaminase-like putative cysteine protease
MATAGIMAVPKFDRAGGMAMERAIALGIALVGIGAVAQEPIAPPRGPAAPRLVREDWQAASIDGVRAGYLLFSVHEYDVNGQKILRATRKLSLTLRRFGDIARVEAETGADETPDGKVTGVFMRQGLGKGIDLNVRGVVQGDQLHVTAEGKMQFDKKIPWPEKVLGAYGEYQFISKLRPEPGREFEYLIYEPIINRVVKVQGKAEAIEVVPIAGQSPRLLRVSTQPLQIEDTELPASTFWYDYRYELIKTETLMPGVGKMTLERTTREDATRPNVIGPDLGWRQSIKLKQRLLFPHDASAITYRLKLKDKNPESVFRTDNRQAVKKVGDGTIELTVTPVRQPPAAPATGAPPGPEYLSSNYFITSDDPRVRAHALAAVGAENDPMKKARLIERWVHTNMRVMNFTEAMAPASEVAKTMTGDCTEYSMLMAAMCRAAGVPSRPALGLVYVDARDGRDAVLAMHMWTEVWVNGEWIGLDATIGRGSIGSAHLKISDHSWDRVTTMTPLMPLMRLIMSQPEVEVVKEQRADS